MTYVGHYAIPQIIQYMETRNLHYYWIFAVVHTGPFSSFFAKNILVKWKPLLWFVKGESEKPYQNSKIFDLINSARPEKILHDWEQASEEARYIIGQLTKPGDTIFDPFMGSGTTGISALNLRRQFIGIEINPESFEVAKVNVAKRHYHYHCLNQKCSRSVGQSKEMTSTKDSSDNSTKSRLTEEQKQQVRFWIRTMGCNLAACYSQEKNIYKERWGDNIINEIDYDTRLEQGWYNDGVAVICGQLRHGSYKAKWITCLDFDSKDAFDKFCEILGTNLEKLAKWTRVEWHNSLESMHVFLISNKPFKNLAATGIEVKANKLLAFVSPSLHKSGEEYRAFDGESIAILDSIDQLRTESIIDIFIKTCTDDQRSYFDEDAKQKYIEYLNAEGTILRAGERHPGTIANGTSMFFKHKGEWRDLSDPQRFEKLVAWHKRVCDPPLFDVPDRENEVQEIWDDICKKYTGKRQQERDAREDDEAINGRSKKECSASLWKKAERTGRF